MDLTIANISTQIDDPTLQAKVAAISRQVNEEFQNEWQVAATLTGKTIDLAGGMAPIQGNQDAVIYVGDSSQDPNTGITSMAAYHDKNHAGVPYGFVYLDVCRQTGRAWSCALSHEVLELLVDPSASQTQTGPDPSGGPGTVEYDLEVCDPVEGDSYPIDSVMVSNFVGQSYFGRTGGSGMMNQMGLPLVSFGARPKGYFQYETGGSAFQIKGDRVIKSQFEAKKLMENGRRNERRIERLARPKAEVPAQPAEQKPIPQIGRTLRQIMATNPILRRQAQRAAMVAAKKVLKEAGVKITAADVAEARADIAALGIPAGQIVADAGPVLDGNDLAVRLALGIGI